MRPCRWRSYNTSKSSSNNGLTKFYLSESCLCAKERNCCEQNIYILIAVSALPLMHAYGEPELSLTTFFYLAFVSSKYQMNDTLCQNNKTKHMCHTPGSFQCKLFLGKVYLYYAYA